MTLVARAWDLVDPGDASSFLAPLGLLDRAREAPLPCRAVWRPGVIPPAASGLDLVIFTAPRGAVLCGAASSLRRLAAAWPIPDGPELAALLDRYEGPPPRLRFADGTEWDFAGRSRVMGILNVTPDSFSDGGAFEIPEAALRHAGRMLDEGADIVDVGGESTRPGAAPVSQDEELRRTAPIVEALRRQFPRARISIDTRRAGVAREALARGADMINDISALADPAMAPLAAQARVPIVLMHMRGTPRTMQLDTHYDDLIGEVAGFLAERAEIAREGGVAGDRILLDPGFGFGKSADGNELLLRQLRSLSSLGRPLMVGASRKAFLGRATGVKTPADRLGASVAAAVAASLEGAAVVRVHDVGVTRQALDLAVRLRARREGEERS